MKSQPFGLPTLIRINSTTGEFVSLSSVAMSSEKGSGKTGKEICLTCLVHEPNKDLPCSHPVCCQCLSEMNERKEVKCPKCHACWESVEQVGVKEERSDSEQAVGDTGKELRTSLKGENEDQPKCSEHLRDIVHWCENCKKVACTRCVSTTHKRHALCDVEESTDELKMFMSDSASEISDLSKECQRRVHARIACAKEKESEQEEEITKHQWAIEKLKLEIKKHHQEIDRHQQEQVKLQNFEEELNEKKLPIIETRNKVRAAEQICQSADSASMITFVIYAEKMKKEFISVKQVFDQSLRQMEEELLVQISDVKWLMTEKDLEEYEVSFLSSILLLSCSVRCQITIHLCLIHIEANGSYYNMCTFIE